VIHRVADGVCAVMLALKKRPLVRYSSRSQLSQKLVEELDRRISADRGLYHFRDSGAPPLLLVIDRKDDAVTPLLSQWTYQAMVHDLLGIDNNRVDLKHVPGIKPDLREVVLSGQQDPFFKENAYANFGELGDNIKELVDMYQSKTKSNKDIQSIEDIKRFVEEFPEFQKMAGNVTKHVTIMGELNRSVSRHRLLEGLFVRVCEFSAFSFFCVFHELTHFLFVSQSPSWSKRSPTTTTTQHTSRR
jgi:vacuolar protein sorting-associated protein 45